MKYSRWMIAAVVFSACSNMGTSTLEVHDVLFYGDMRDRYTWFYDALKPEASHSDIKINGIGYLLGANSNRDAFALSGTLSINKQSVLKSLTNPFSRDVFVNRLANGQYNVQTSRELSKVLYTDGKSWYSLGENFKPGTHTVAASETISGLKNAAKLNDNEATVLANHLRSQAPLVVAILPENVMPDKAYTIVPKPKNYLSTSIMVQKGIPSEATDTTQNIIPKTLGSGNNSGYAEGNFTVYLSNNASSFGTVWKMAQSNRVPYPGQPSVNFETSSVVSLFMGSKPTGGYSFKVNSIRASGSILQVNVALSTPREGAILTQAFTSPWISLSVSGNRFRTVEVRDDSGNLLSRAEVQ